MKIIEKLKETFRSKPPESRELSPEVLARLPFKVGEILPWKGVCLRLKAILRGEMIFEPVGFTGKIGKKKKGGVG